MDMARKIAGLRKRHGMTQEQAALLAVPVDMPYRGPLLYKEGDKTYSCSVTGDFTWFHGTEYIYHGEKKVYECLFHGGRIQ